MVIENNSDELIYRVRGQPGPPDVVDGIAVAVGPGESDRSGMGGERTDPEPGGCFRNQQLWIIRSKSGTPFPYENVADRADDIEILRFFPNGSTCTSRDELVYIWPDDALID